MEFILMVVGLLLAAWILGFLGSARKLANMANREATRLELIQAESLKKSYTKESIKEAKDYLTEFDGL